jgi:hypothetical protein
MAGNAALGPGLAGPAAEPTASAHPALWRDGLFWLTLVLSLFAVAPFLQPGYFWGANDARHHVYFLYEYDRLVQDGIWWPRWSPDFAFGYGYPFFNIYGLFSHFLAELLLRFGALSYTDAVEAVFGLSIVGSAGAMYGYVRSWGGRPAALIAGLTYVYIPYHLLNLYVRANLAESMAFVWLPLALWGARETVVRPGYRAILLLAVSFAGLMLTSNLVVVLFTPLLAAYVLLLTLRWALRARGNRFVAWLRALVAPALGGLGGLGLSAAFWLPAFLERQYVRVDQWFDGRYAYQGHFVYLHQFLSPQWGFGVSVPGPDDPISFQIGAAALALTLLGLITTWRRLGELRWEMALLAAAALAAAFFTSQSAAPLWEMPVVGGLLQTAQFPWRWLVVTALCTSALAGLAGYWIPDRPAPNLPLIVLAGLVIWSSYSYLKVEVKAAAEGPVSLASLMRFQQSSDEMTGSTAWVKEIPTWSPMAEYYIQQEWEGKPDEPVETKLDYGIFDGETFVADSVANNSVMEEVYFYNSRGTPQRLIFNQFYYPGWHAYLLDGRHGARLTQVEIIPEPEGTLGRMTVAVPPGEGYLLLIYEDTPPRQLGGALSITAAGLLALAGLNLWVTRWRRITSG